MGSTVEPAHSVLQPTIALVTSPMFVQVIAVKNPVYLVNLDKIYKKLRNISKAKKDFGPNLERWVVVGCCVSRGLAAAEFLKNSTYCGEHCITGPF